MSKKRKRRLALAVCAAAGAAMLFIWSFTSLGARLCFTARILAALPDAGKEAEDGLSEDGSQLMFRNQQTLALLAELALTGKYEDLTGCQMTTWESPGYWIDDFEVGGERVLFHTHMGRFYLVEPGDSTMKRRFGEILERAGCLLYTSDAADE